MEPTPTAEATAAISELGLHPDDVKSWREEGYTLLIVTHDDEKHRITRHAKIAEDDAARKKEEARKQREAEGRAEEKEDTHE